MLISHIIEDLQELRSELRSLTQHFITFQNEYTDEEVPIFSELWREMLWEHLSFQDDSGNWYGLFTFVEDEDDIPQATIALQNPDVLANYVEMFKTYVSTEKTQEEVVALLKQSDEIISKINNIASEYKLGVLGFESDLFLGFDRVHYESSRCW